MMGYLPEGGCGEEEVREGGIAWEGGRKGRTEVGREEGGVEGKPRGEGVRDEGTRRGKGRREEPKRGRC